MKKTGWKFEYHKAISDYSLTNAERATLTAIWDYADGITGTCWPTDAQINEKCGRSSKAKLSDHKKKFVELGLLTISGHGRKTIYHLNKSVKSVIKSVSQSSQVRNDDGQVRNDYGVSQSPLLTNTPINTPTNTSITIKETEMKPIKAIPNKEKMDALKIKLLEECGEVVPPDYPNNSIYFLLDKKNARSEHSDRELTTWEKRQEAINAEFRGAE